jgi:hypothetical protein
MPTRGTLAKPAAAFLSASVLSVGVIVSIRITFDVVIAVAIVGATIVVVVVVVVLVIVIVVIVVVVVDDKEVVVVIIANTSVLVPVVALDGPSPPLVAAAVGCARTWRKCTSLRRAESVVVAMPIPRQQRSSGSGPLSPRVV